MQLRGKTILEHSRRAASDISIPKALSSGTTLCHQALTSSPRCDVSLSSPPQMPQELTVLVRRLPLPMALPCVSAGHAGTSEFQIRVVCASKNGTFCPLLCHVGGSYGTIGMHAQEKPAGSHVRAAGQSSQPELSIHAPSAHWPLLPGPARECQSTTRTRAAAATTLQLNTTGSSHDMSCCTNKTVNNKQLICQHAGGWGQ